MAFGLDPSGFIRPTREAIQAEIEAASKAAFGPAITLVPGSVFGNLVAIMTDREDTIWLTQEAIWLSQHVRNAVGESLDNAVAYIGIERLTAVKSKSDPSNPLIATGTNGTIITAGAVISVAGNPAAKFVTLAPATISGGTAELDVEAQVTGQVVAPAGTLTVIETVISGWTGVTNPTDIIVGRDLETDEELRIRARESIQVTGASQVDAIRARMRQEVAGVLDALVQENSGDVVDPEGRPPHSYEVIVDGGADVEVGQLVWDTKPVGIQLVGNTAAEVEDADGHPQLVLFTRPTPINIFIIVNVTPNDAFPQDQTAAAADIKQRVLDFCETTFLLGDDILPHKIVGIVDATPGVEDLDVLVSRDAGPPTLSDNVVISPKEKPVFLAGNITVNVLP